ncbi:MAG TPA: ATP-binding protein, partial [Chryseosolibacter sp.]
IKVSGDALIVLINDILDLAKVDAGKMTFEATPFKMALSISAMLHLFETKIQEKNLVLVKEYDQRIPQVLVGDPVRLHQIILNLVSNAVKFTTKGQITVTVHLHEEDEEKVIVEFTVTDTGIGIEPDRMLNIFENFQQATSGTSRLYGGTGLGLAIVKQLVEAQGGTIEVKSTPDLGSVFSFQLGFEKTTSEAELATIIVQPDTRIKNIKVLVVEDIALNQLLMRTVLNDFGFECEIAANGRLAVELLASKKFDLILMDLQMPEMNGFEATEYIRDKMGLTIPIIALTADVTTVDLQKCKAVGMNDYIAKPIDERVLYSKIIGFLGKPGKPDDKGTETKSPKCTNLEYLTRRTKSDKSLMIEMISLFLVQTESLIILMKKSTRENDWALLHATVHKMIPSFSIMGILPEFEKMARQIQEFAGNCEHTEEIPGLVLQLIDVLEQANEELEEELATIKTTTV